MEHLESNLFDHDGADRNPSVPALPYLIRTLLFQGSDLELTRFR